MMKCSEIYKISASQSVFSTEISLSKHVIREFCRAFALICLQYTEFKIFCRACTKKKEKIPNPGAYLNPRLWSSVIPIRPGIDLHSAKS